MLTYFSNQITITLNLEKRKEESQLMVHHVDIDVHRVDLVDKALEANCSRIGST